MAEPQLFYIGTSKKKEIRSGDVTSFDWGDYSSWKKFKSPIKDSLKKVKYNKTAKDKIGAKKYGGLGGVTKLGTTIPATATRYIDGVARTCEVRYYQRGYTNYVRTSALKQQNKMAKYTYTKDKPYQYRLQYKDKPIKEASYSSYSDGMDYIYFADHYWKDGTRRTRSNYMAHPTTFAIKFSDVMKNLDSKANNSENRDNKGTFVLKNVRANVVTLELAWAGLPANEAADLLDTLNPSKDSKGQYNYLVVQFMNPATGKATTKTFYASDRSAEAMNNGWYKDIKVTLTEV